MGKECLRRTGQQILKAGGIYFALVFGAGFVLGTLRVLFMVPVIGSRTAELVEMPVMLVGIILAARWVVCSLDVPSTACARLSMGGIALLLILALDFSVVL